MESPENTTTSPPAPSWKIHYHDWVLRQGSGSLKRLYEVSKEDRDWLGDLSVIECWIDHAGLTWHWKTPKRESEMERNIYTILTREQRAYVENLAYLSLQPHLEEERLEYLAECLSGFFWWWPEEWKEGEDTWRTYQDRVLEKASTIKEYMEFEALDRAIVVAPLPWREWLCLSPSHVSIVAYKVRDTNSRMTTLRWRRPDFEQSDSESEEERDWEEEFWKLGEEERAAIQKEWEEEDFRAEVARNRREHDSDIEADVRDWRRRGFTEDEVEEGVVEFLCSYSDGTESNADASVTTKSQAGSSDLGKPETPSASDSVWGRSSDGVWGCSSSPEY